jgi:uncharacterized protein with FMN-binding domain
MKTDEIVALVCIIAIIIALQWSFTQLPVSKISIDNPQSVVVNQGSSFSLVINDARNDRSYSADVIVDGVRQGTYGVFNGSNSLSFKIEKQGTSKVEVLVYDINNEYNGYGSKAAPWSLYFKVNASE